MIRYPWIVDRWDGGLAEDSRIGLPGSASYMLGADIDTDIGILQAAPTLSLYADEDDIPNSLEQIRWGVASDGENYFYGGQKIYKDVSGTITKVRTLAGGNGHGLGLFDGNLYYRHGSNLGKFDLASTWDDTFSASMESPSIFGQQPMLNYKNLLLIANGRYLATIDDVGTLDLTTLTFPETYFLETMCEHNGFVFMGCNYGYGLSTGFGDNGVVFYWDGNKETYIDYFPVGDRIHKLISFNGMLIGFIGRPVKICVFTGTGFKPMYQTKLEYVLSGAADVHNGKLVFGGQAFADPTTYISGAAYEWGQRSMNTAYTLNSKFNLSVDSPIGDDSAYVTLVMSRVASGAAAKSLFVGWYDRLNSVGGIDRKSLTGALQSPVTYRTLVFDNKNPQFKRPNKAIIELVTPLASGESVNFKISTDPYTDPLYEDSTVYKEKAWSYAVDGAKKYLEFSLSQISVKSRELGWELVLAGTGSTRPKAKRVIVDIEEENESL